MKIRTLAFCLAIILLPAIFAAPAARADIYWENENISQGIPGQKDGVTLQKNYFTATAARIETGDGKILITDYDTMMLYNLNPADKTYSVIDLNQPIGVPPKMSGPDKERMGKMMGQMMQIRITPTDEIKTIQGYKCRKYLADIAMVQGIYWVSKDVKGYQELRAIGAKLASAAERNPMLRQMNVAAMVEKLDGFPVQAVNSVMGGTITSTLKKAEQKKLEPALFKVPRNYVMK
ncbi:MAG: DUF4412 domain-containing protein [Syntrophobacteraceae bacterium]